MKKILNHIGLVLSGFNPKTLDMKYRIFLIYVLLFVVFLSGITYIFEKKFSDAIESKSGSFIMKINDQILKNIDRDIYELDRHAVYRLPDY